MIKEIFSEKDGQLSLMRFMCFGCFLMAVFLCIYGVIFNCIEIYHIQIIEWLGFAFVGKVGQKFVEK